jgi:Response regulator containing CheY-like receiver domain and AraC-type DNA-binding domain
VTSRKEGIEGGESAFNELSHFLQTHYCENLSNTEIAARFHFHPNYLSQLMVANTGKSLHQYIIDLRIKKALSLLMYSSMNISEISSAVGFSDIHYFSRHFKKRPV